MSVGKSQGLQEGMRQLKGGRREEERKKETDGSGFAFIHIYR